MTYDPINISFAVQFDYPVLFVEDAFDPDDPGLARIFDRLEEGRRHRVAVVLDSGVNDARPELARSIEAYFHAHSDQIEMAGPLEIFSGGPAAKKGYDRLEHTIWNLGNLHMDRQSFVLAIGGGSVLDAVGLAVSLVHRGLRLVRMPTTVLSQCDAGIGVKNGVDEHEQKNFLGTFAPPFAVINDLSLLTSLDDLHWRSGIAEAFKVALIRDRDFFDFLCRHAAALRERDYALMSELIHRCAAIHLNHIGTAGDPFEMGSARPLDFGHWAAHRLEIMSQHRMGHGQSVAIGIALDCDYAHRHGLLSEAERDAIFDALEAAGLPTYVADLSRRRPDGELQILQGLADFREHLGGRLTVTMPDGIGHSIELHHLSADQIEAGIKALAARAGEDPACT
ncbi:MAG: 3-dehydroquinate synthase [Kiritimatiellia bacterium]|jgi:3-dehydroquinate synthase|nr:3-dehydroquinate synthase [Kiritimatiellia bacterium]MDP6629775.1 3-dehydroquinate synthase [Kiritimatiellia bacterium]MDP6811051.1 3-dehydroquinate synthase [Kiritimatiellia bacterium]MDP7023094.1 3-dehydroquinate synthase [Kiritimatiellia bacterium]